MTGWNVSSQKGVKTNVNTRFMNYLAVYPTILYCGFIKRVGNLKTKKNVFGFHLAAPLLPTLRRKNHH